MAPVGRASGSRVHASGIPWTDPSGDQLRDWLGFDRPAFHDTSRIAILPMGFCYPGVDRSGGDKPPRPECAPLWHDRLRAQMPDVALTLLVGGYAQRRYLGKRACRTLTETVRNWRAYMPDCLPLLHPSWRNSAWLNKNPWFEAEVLPVVRAGVRRR